MTPEHLSAILAAAEAKKDEKGWSKAKEGRLVTFYIANNGVSLSVARIEAVRLEGKLVHTRSVKDETFVLCLDDIFAGAVEAPVASGRKAGFV